MKKVYVLFVVFLIMGSFGFAGPGKFEVGFHYSYWTINMIATMVEDMTPDLNYYDPDKGELNFDSNGNNFGFEFRFFPGGENGSFSVGLSYERNNFKAKVSDFYTDTINGTQGEVSLDGNIDLRPHSFNLSLRWELWPSARIHPYLGFGFGFGALSGTASYNVEVNLYGEPNPPPESGEWTLKDLIDEYEQKEGKSFPLSFFPIIHLNFGFRGEVIDNLYLLAEVAVYDGLIFRGGLAYRF
ncbi:MAG: hypothetical protein KAT34_04745 [Candidatus Aminicenantes bacterium]|nr:hypothetical protein [Candidatus Aminicenantes bacterium]